MQEKKTIIKLSDVWKIYQLGSVSVPALRGVNLEIFSGSFVGITGPSGSGKSTLLNMVGCLDLPSKGKIFLSGEDTSLFSESKLATVRGKKIGFVFQQFNLFHNLTALENVTIPMVFQQTPEEKRIERAKNLLVAVGLGDRINHLPSELSGGERQRVAIARAFANKPEIVIADEPTGNLDSVAGKKVMNLLAKFYKEQGGTIVVVTHDVSIAHYAEKLFHIKDGKIIDGFQQNNENN